MALAHGVHLNGSSLLECFVRIPSHIAYGVFKEAPNWFFEELASHFRHKGELFPTVLQFIEIDIENTDSTLFREDSVTSKFLNGVLYADNCGEFLFNCMYPTVADVRSLKAPLELNPAKVTSDMPTIDETMETVQLLVDNLLRNIAVAINECPITYRLLLARIKKLVADKFKNETLERNIVCSFFFLRFICPALVSPDAYRVPCKANLIAITEELTMESRRCMVLISKVLQCIGNGSKVDSSKETWLQIVNSYIVTKFDEVDQLFQMLLDEELILKKFIHTKEYEEASFIDDRPPHLISARCEEYIRTKIIERHSLEGFLYDTMRTLPQISRSHPVTWSKDEVHIWLRGANLGKFIPVFESNDIYGMRFINLDRQQIRSLLGVVRFAQQTEIMYSIKDLVQKSACYLPTAEESSIAESVRSWDYKDVLFWLDAIECASLKKAVRSVRMSGEKLLALKPDAFYYLGLSKKVNYVIKKKRVLHASIFMKDLEAISRIRGMKKSSVPSLFDHAIDDWLHRMQLSPKSSSSDSVRAANSAADLQPSGITQSTSVASHSTGDLTAFTTVRARSESQDEDDELEGTQLEGGLTIRDELIMGLLHRRKKSGKKRMRMFVLHQDSGLLCEHKRSLDITLTSARIRATRSLNTINVRDCIVRSVDFLAGHPNCFSISKKSKEGVILEAFSQEAAELWIKHLIKFAQVVSVEKLNIEIFAVPIIVMKTSGRLLEANALARAILGLTGSLEGKFVKNIVPSISSLSSLVGKEYITDVVCKDARLPMSIKVGTFIEGAEERYIMTLHRNISRLMPITRNRSPDPSQGWDLEQLKDHLVAYSFTPEDQLSNGEPDLASPAKPLGFLSLLESEYL